MFNQKPVTEWWYKGWYIKFNPQAPITGQYQATLYGVTINNNSLYTIKKMIDYKVMEKI